MKSAAATVRIAMSVTYRVSSALFRRRSERMRAIRTNARALWKKSDGTDRTDMAILTVAAADFIAGAIKPAQTEVAAPCGIVFHWKGACLPPPVVIHLIDHLL